MAAPEPEESDSARQDALEDEQEENEHWGTMWFDTTSNEYLTEIAAPSPISCRQCSQTESRLSRRDTQRSRTTVADGDVLNRERLQERLVRRFWSESVTISWLVFFSLLGTLARLGIEAIATYPNAPFLSTVLWANLGGSFFLGFLIEDRKLFEKVVQRSLSPETSKDDEKRGATIKARKTALPLYIGLATGFCGSFTSFSTLISDAFLALSNSLPSPSPSSPYHAIPVTSIYSRNGGYSFMAVLGILIIQTCVGVSALKAGAQLALELQPIVPALPVEVLNNCLNLVALPIGIGSWIGAILLSIWPPGGPVWRARATLPLAFAPIGCLARFYTSKYLNPMLPAFPLGTFVINIFGTCVSAMCFDLQRAESTRAPSSITACALLQGVIQGFSGCATTVSTWVAELQSLMRRHAWVYGIASIGVALSCQIVIVGPVRWTIGLKNASCMV
ncbi:MAG: hypothetical protein Q9160_008759 [Pyrenula sp. 1 TL-2023]